MSSVLASGMPFLLQTVLTRILSPEDYGKIFIFQIISMTVLPLTHLSYNVLIEKSYFDKNIKSVVNIRSTAIITSITAGLIWIFLSLIITNVFGFDLGIKSYLVQLACLFAVMETLYTYGMSHFKIIENFKQLAFFQILVVIIDGAFTLLFIVKMEIGWEGRLYSKLIAWGLIGVFFIINFYRKGLLRIKWDLEKYKELNRFSIPLIPHTLSTLLITVSDRALISFMEGPKDLGLYSIGYQWGLIITTLGVAFNKVWQPLAYKQLNIDSDSSKLKLTQAFYAAMSIILVAAIGLFVFSPFLINILLGEAFHSSSKFVQFISFAYTFNIGYILILPIIYFKDSTRLIFKITLFTAILNLILNYILIKKFGAIGAAQATLISFTVKFLLIWYLSNKLHKLPWLSIKNMSWKEFK